MTDVAWALDARSATLPLFIILDTQIGYKQQHMLQRIADCKNVGHLFEIAKFLHETILRRIRLRDIAYIGIAYSGGTLCLTHGSHHDNKKNN